MSQLFTQVKLGEYELNNRIVMAPMTRGRADQQGIPNSLMAKYYEQRSDAGLIITEATAVSQQGRGWMNSPGMYNDQQQQGWNLITDAVHQQGGRIFTQLWHMGRMVLPDFNNNKPPVAPSAIRAEGGFKNPDGESKDFVGPIALSVAEIQSIVNDFRLAARRAIDSGMDGVEIHAANGFLIDQFTRSSTNLRTDQYGGDFKKRTRFLLEVTQAIVGEIGAGKVGLRLSPTLPIWGISDATPELTFGWIAEQLNEFNLAYLHILEPPKGIKHTLASDIEPLMGELRKHYRGVLIANGGYDQKNAESLLENNNADAIAFGVPYIANPDLVRRFKDGLNLKQADENSFYTQGEAGYIDYTFAPQITNDLGNTPHWTY